jgi:hypothetical protein
MEQPSDKELRPSDLEVERWQFERELKLREQMLREREQTNRDAEVELKRLEQRLREREQVNRDAEIEIKRTEQRNATWRNPLTVAVFAAALAGASNALVAVVNGSLQRDLERAKRDSEITLERTKSESTRILEMIKTGSTETAAGNLTFLLQSGLVTDAAISAKLSAYLATRTPGSGPALPSPNTRIGFDENTPIDRTVQQELEERFAEYLAFLDRTGFPPASKKVLIKLDDTNIGNTYYDGSKIVIDERVADDPSVPLREYTHHVLAKHFEGDAYRGQYAAIESALADYFTCSFLNNPKLGEKAAKVWGIDKPYIRILKNERRFTEFGGPRLKNVDAGDYIYEGSEIWGGLFWSLREQLGGATVDKLLAAAWQAFKVPGKEQARAKEFAATLLAQSRKLGAAQEAAVLETLRRRGFPAPI